MKNGIIAMGAKCYQHSRPSNHVLKGDSAMANPHISTDTTSVPPVISADFLRHALNYDPHTGIFTWKSKISRCVTLGKIAGCPASKGKHHRISINGVMYAAHHLAWLYVYGEYPTSPIRHISHDPLDNRIANLEALDKYVAVKILARDELSVSGVDSILAYNPANGKFTWKPGTYGHYQKPDAVGSTDSNGYLSVEISGFSFMLHRLAWLVSTGDWPKGEIDHINGNRKDNRLCNLRDVCKGENQQNIGGARTTNTSGLIGAHWSKRKKKYCSEIRVSGARHFLGYFDTAEEASNAYLKAKAENHPFSARLAGGAL